MIDIAAALRDVISDPEVSLVSKCPIFYPRTANEASLAVVAANEHRFKICPCGTLSRLGAKDLPESTLLLSSGHMKSVIELARDDLFVTVESGMNFGDLSAILAESQLSLPPAFTTYDGSVGAAASLGISYGTYGDSFHIRQIVPSIECVTPTGKILRSGAVTIKSVAGYDIARFMCGAGGAFGYLTSVTFHLKPGASRRLLSGNELIAPDSVSAKWDASLLTDRAMKALKLALDPTGILPTAVG